jgi:hypothetical protein
MGVSVAMPTHDEVPSPAGFGRLPGFPLLTRGVAAAAVGALQGYVLNRIDVWSLSRQAPCSPANSFCSDIGYQFAPIGYAVEGVALGALAMALICSISFALAGVDPIWASAPLGVLLTLVTVLAYTSVYTHSGAWNGNAPELGPAWVVTLIFAGVFGALGMAVTGLARRIRKRTGGWITPAIDRILNRHE